jgi:hypothetical protein
MEFLEKELPSKWKLAIAKNIENNLFSKVSTSWSSRDHRCMRLRYCSAMGKSGECFILPPARMRTRWVMDVEKDSR